jgi:5-methylcytosine-specific restriction endonuclease McrA
VRPIEEVNAERREAAMRECYVCGERYLNKTNSKGYCCSRKCGDTMLRWRGERTRALTQARQELANWAKPDRIIGFKSRIAKLRRRLERKAATCATCGCHIEQSPISGWKRYCSKACRPVNEDVKRKHRKIAKAKRRAKMRGAHCESVDPLKVFERDGWKCHLCGKTTDATKRGTWHQDAPELDHIIPLSKGGPHTYANTACSCRSCNNSKSNKIVRQSDLLAA